jgi:hypothetical protein
MVAYNITPTRPAGGYAIGGISFSADPPTLRCEREGGFVVIESVVFRMNICAEKPAHNKFFNR